MSKFPPSFRALFGYACPLRGLAVVLTLLLAAPCSFAQDYLTVDLRVPTPLQVGQVYDAELRVRSQKAIPDAYVKISLPYALKVVSGQTS